MGAISLALGFALPFALSLAVYWGARDFQMPLPSVLRAVDVQQSRLPKPAALQGVYAPNEALRRSQRLFGGLVQGAESVAVGPDGALFMLDKFGYLFKAERLWDSSSSSTPEFQLHSKPVNYVGPGRPLGAHFDTAGNLIICDSLKGLTMLEAETGRLVILANRVSPDSALQPDTTINYANDLDVGGEGRIYFTDSTAIPPALNRGGWYDSMRSYMLTMWQGGATGRVLAFDPSTGQTQVLAQGFWYANGVAISPDGYFLAVVETVSMRVHRHWLYGPKAGTTELLISGLPGFPDGITRSSDGNFWLSLVLPNVPIIHKVLPHKALRWAMAWASPWLPLRLPQWGMVVKVSPEGEVLQTLMDPDGSVVSHVSAVTEYDGQLFLGCLAKDYVSMLSLSSAEL